MIKMGSCTYSLRTLSITAQALPYAARTLREYGLFNGSYGGSRRAFAKYALIWMKYDHYEAVERTHR